ncbi:hypothetical protein ACFFMN_40745 [Planobispora siamensis]|nr:hypothetical protein [Planobispora siamensis]
MRRPARESAQAGAAMTFMVHSLAWRALVWVTGTAAPLVAMPPDYRAGLVMPLFAGLLALLTAAEPEGGWVLPAQIVTVAAWLVTTVVYGYAPSPAAGLVIGLLLYLHHGAAAIAAQIPVAARIPAPVLAAWLARTGTVSAASAAVCLLVAALTGAAGAAIPAAAAVVLGAAGALAVARALRQTGRGAVPGPDTGELRGGAVPGPDPGSPDERDSSLRRW